MQRPFQIENRSLIARTGTSELGRVPPVGDRRWPNKRTFEDSVQIRDNCVDHCMTGPSRKDSV
jgi:hypothetical protein